MYDLRYLILLIMFSPLLLAQAKDEYRTFTSNEGSKIEARITESSDSDSVTLERRDGRTFKDVGIKMFSEKDQKYISEWQKKEEAKFENADPKPDSRLVISVLKGRNDEFNDYGDIDDRIVSFSPSIIVKNEEVKYSYKAVSGSLVIIGENIMNNKQHVILSRQDFKLNVGGGVKTA